MEKFEGLTEGPLSVMRMEDGEKVSLNFTGKSILRDPTEILQPILLQVLDEAEQRKCHLILDFRKLTYMNSSTFTPLIKFLEKARQRTSQVTVLFCTDKKWQTVSFNALTIFATDDKRICIEGRL